MTIQRSTPGRTVGRSGQRAALSRALRTMSYEVLPFKSTEDAVLAHVPRDIALTITTTESKGLTPTLELATRLTRHGYSAAPHVAARLVRDKAHLADITAELDAAGVRDLFVIGGDAREPAGIFPDALSLLEALHATGQQFRRVGIGGYPEGHGHIGTELIDQALQHKTYYATHLITQLCFDSATTANWAREIRQRGIGLPVRVGIPGAVNRQKLMRISAGLGLGQSARFLRKQQSLLWRFFLPGGYNPNRLIEGLAASLEQPDTNLQGFHVFTFNELEKTEAWRQRWLARLSDGAQGHASPPAQFAKPESSRSDRP